MVIGSERIVRRFSVMSSPDDAIPPRRALDEAAVAIQDFHASAVELWLHAVADSRVVREPAGHSSREVFEIFFGVRVVERHHRRDVLDGLEVGARRAAHALRGGLRDPELRMLFLQRREARDRARRTVDR